LIIKRESTVSIRSLASEVVILCDRLPVPSILKEPLNNLVGYFTADEFSFGTLFEPEATGVFFGLFLGIAELAMGV
jgi:hypothetical protein